MGYLLLSLLLSSTFILFTWDVTISRPCSTDSSSDVSSTAASLAFMFWWWSLESQETSILTWKILKQNNQEWIELNDARGQHIFILISKPFQPPYIYTYTDLVPLLVPQSNILDQNYIQPNFFYQLALMCPPMREEKIVYIYIYQLNIIWIAFFQWASFSTKSLPEQESICGTYIEHPTPIQHPLNTDKPADCRNSLTYW